MGLADAVRPDQAQAFGAVRKRLGKPAHRGDRVDELLVGIDLEVLEVAAAIARRDARLFKQPAGVLALPALAAHDTTDASRPLQAFQPVSSQMGQGIAMLNAEC